MVVRQHRLSDLLDSIPLLDLDQAARLDKLIMRNMVIAAASSAMGRVARQSR
ncbi:hypothetical protein [Mesorhizobium captivum]|uniref:hypothetical protein n=1 Tax=Mesorhizobium captivum TaxID=3072319 RepID=UPI003D6B08AF